MEKPEGKQMAPPEKKHNPKRVKTGRDNQEWGKIAEQIAADYFLTHGFTIRERNWSCGKNEVDIILEENRTLIFVEVKARKRGTQDPIDAVGRAKRQRIIRAADIFLQQESLLYQYRFDIFTVTGDAQDYTVEHYPDAYMPPVNVR